MDYQHITKAVMEEWRSNMTSSEVDASNSHDKNDSVNYSIHYTTAKGKFSISVTTISILLIF